MKGSIVHNGAITGDSILTNTGSTFFNYGTGFFETILYEQGRVFFWEDHLRRLEQTAEVFEFSLEKEWLSESLVHELIRHNRCENETLRIKILCAPLQDPGVWDVVMFCRPYERADRDYEVFIHWEPRDGFFCSFKSVNYHALLYWNHYYKKHFHADEVLMCGLSGHILEGSVSNVLAVKKRALYYVDVHDNYLAGIMQKHIIREYKGIGFHQAIPVKGGFSSSFLEEADEVLLSNSLVIVQRTGMLHPGKKKEVMTYTDYGWKKKIQDFFLTF
jgi:branched-subunit amino acid aminotransferase/4-amino-4-deoxychorismate lyase